MAPNRCVLGATTQKGWWPAAQFLRCARSEVAVRCSASVAQCTSFSKQKRVRLVHALPYPLEVDERRHGGFPLEQEHLAAPSRARMSSDADRAAVVADDHGATTKLSASSSTRRVSHVQVVRSVRRAAGGVPALRGLGEVRPFRSPPDQVLHHVLLVRPRKLNPARSGARVHCACRRRPSCPPQDLLIHDLAAVEQFRGLRPRTPFTVCPPATRALSSFSSPRSCGTSLPAPVGPIAPTMPAAGKVEVSKSGGRRSALRRVAFAITTSSPSHSGAGMRSRRCPWLYRSTSAAVPGRAHARLALGLPPRWHADPLEAVPGRRPCRPPASPPRPCASVLRPRRWCPCRRKYQRPGEDEDQLGDVVQEDAVVRHCHDGALELQ